MLVKRVREEKKVVEVKKKPKLGSRVEEVIPTPQKPHPRIKELQDDVREATAEHKELQEEFHQVFNSMVKDLKMTSTMLCHHIEVLSSCDPEDQTQVALDNDIPKWMIPCVLDLIQRTEALGESEQALKAARAALKKAQRKK